MKRSRLLKLGGLMMVILALPVFFIKAENIEIDAIDSLTSLKKQADQILFNEVIPNLEVRAINAERELTEKNQEGAVVVKTISYTGLGSLDTDDHTVINFEGAHVSPNASVFISFQSAANTVKKAVVDQAGIWSVDVPVNILSLGENLAYIYTEKDGVKSEKVAIASFDFSSEYKISQKTWYFIGLVTVAIIFLLFAIILQLRSNARDLEPGRLI